MSETLIIAEKPSVAATIAAALGAKGEKGRVYRRKRLSCFLVRGGIWYSLRKLPPMASSTKKWSYDSLPILPQEWQYAVASDKGKQFKILKRPHTPRRRFRSRQRLRRRARGRTHFSALSMMWRAVKSPCAVFGFPLWKKAQSRRALRPSKTGKSTTPLYSSALCRAKADWIIGINMTRLFSCLYGKTLNVGRVQTPDAQNACRPGTPPLPHLRKKNTTMCACPSPAWKPPSAKIHAADEAGNLKAACEAAQAVCTSVTREKKTVAPAETL